MRGGKKQSSEPLSFHTKDAPTLGAKVTGCSFPRGISLVGEILTANKNVIEVGWEESHYHSSGGLSSVGAVIIRPTRQPRFDPGVVWLTKRTRFGPANVPIFIQAVSSQRSRHRWGSLFDPAGPCSKTVMAKL